MDWKEVIVEINRESLDAVANILEENGAEGVVITEKEAARVQITAYYPDDSSFYKLISQIKNNINGLKSYGLESGEIKYKINLTHDDDWSTSWQKFFKPLPIGERFIICPSWESCADKERIIIKIDPGLAFGIGSHETTQMTVELLEKYITADINNILDVGTGTGILAIVAAKLGVKNINAIDIDSGAIRVAKENVRINRVSEWIKINKGNLTKDVKDRYSLIIANLLPNLILKLLPTIPQYLDNNGLIILSGIIKDKRKIIMTQLKRLNFSLVDEINKNEWITLVARRG